MNTSLHVKNCVIRANRWTRNASVLFVTIAQVTHFKCYGHQQTGRCTICKICTNLKISRAPNDFYHFSVVINRRAPASVCIWNVGRCPMPGWHLSKSDGRQPVPGRCRTDYVMFHLHDKFNKAIVIMTHTKITWNKKESEKMQIFIRHIRFEKQRWSGLKRAKYSQPLLRNTIFV